jgi:putative multiple sugar transport system permease protein
LPNVLIVMALLISRSTRFSQPHHGRAADLRPRRQREGGEALGINTERLTFLTFANMGLLAALAGLVFAARLNSASPKAGVAFELDVIAAVFIGGASMSGGVGRVVGAVIGAFLMGVMNNGMSIMSVGIDYQQVIKGLVLLAAVIFDVYNKKKQS